MTTPRPKLGRRNFFLAVGAGGVATAAAIVAKTGVTPETASSDAQRGSRGYKVSEHIRNYYRTAKV